MGQACFNLKFIREREKTNYTGLYLKKKEGKKENEKFIYTIKLIQN